MADGADTPKGIAASILGPAPMVEDGAAPLPEDDEDTETTALGMMADDLMTAVETKDRTGIVGVFRSLMMMAARNGG